jgi:hypothetical protein
MIDLSHVPEIPGLSVFLPQGTSTDSWQIWNKPRGFVMVSIYAIGPGGGGASGATGANFGGGGGGGSGAVSRLTIPIFMLPDSLYIQVSPGGSGGAPVSNTTGNAGNVTYAPTATVVSMAPSTTAQYLYLEANAGSGGAYTAGGAGGTIASARPFALLGSFLSIAGNAGATAPTNSASGNGITQSTSSQIYGGASGAGGAGSSGGSISGLAGTPFVISSGARPLNNGFSWATIFPLKIYGGCGGGASAVTGVNGIGGGAGSAWGAGGGGGGGSLVAANSSGRGGDGGPGVVIIQCW